MALVAVPGGFNLPRHPAGFPAGGPTYGNMLIDVAGEEAALVCYAPFTGNLRKIHFRTATVTTGDTVDVRVETVDLADGQPSDTLFGTDTNGSVVIADGDDNVIKTATLTADAAVTKGTSLIGVTIVNGSVPGVINIANSNWDNTQRRFPYSSLFAAAAWANNVSSNVYALEDDGGVIYHIPGVYFTSTITAATFNNTSTPDVWGVRIKVPFPCKVDGCWFHCDGDGDIVFKLYDSDGVSVLATTDHDSNVRSATTGGGYYLPFTNDEPTLTKDTFYYLAAEPSSATSITLWRMALPSEASMGSWELGNNMHVASAKDPTGTGDWTHYNNATDGFEKMLCGLHISALDDGAGAGGGSKSKLTGLLK